MGAATRPSRADAPGPIRDRSRRTIAAALSLTSAALCAAALLPAPAAAAGGCPDETVRTGFSASLPDCRAYELVSPAEKHGALLAGIGQEGNLQAAAEGDAFTYFANAPVDPEPAGYANEQQLLSKRNTDGWSTQDLAIPHDGETGKTEGVGEDYRAFSESLAYAFVQPSGAYTPLSPEASEQTPYLRSNLPQGPTGEPCPTPAQQTNGSSCYRPLVTGAEGYANVPAGTHFGELGGHTGGAPGPCPSLAAYCGPEFLAATPDGAHAILSTDAIHIPLTETPDPLGGLYEWTAGKLTLVSIKPKTEPAAPPEATGGELGSPGQYSTRNAISNDGSRVFFTAFEGLHPHLYMRDLTRDETIEVDAGVTGETPIFQLASTDATKVYFTERANSPEGTHGTLYECSIPKAAGPPQATCTQVAPLIQGDIIGAGTDGSTVYYVADPGTAPNPAEEECQQQYSAPGATCELYVRHDGQSKPVAQLSGQDMNDWGQEQETEDLVQLTARVSPNGQWLAFVSQQQLTGYNNHDAISGKPDQEIYLYNAATEELHCASCNPTGAAPHGEEAGEQTKLVTGSQRPPAENWYAADLPGWTPYANSYANYQSRYLSNDGRLFFNSHDGLVPQDENDQWDVYEYEPPQVGDCSTRAAAYHAAAAGCIDLISSGTSAEESAFLDASETGGDVFLLTHTPLSPQDTDTSLDVYDAHECTSSSPCIPPPAAPPAACTTLETCRPTGAPQGSETPPASATITAPPTTTTTTTAAVPAGKPKPLTRAQKLAAALRQCRRKHGARRRTCERQAHRSYAKNARNDRRAAR